MEVNLLADNPAFDGRSNLEEDTLTAIEGCAEVAKGHLEDSAHSIDEATLNGATTSLESIPMLVDEIRRLYKFLGVSREDDQSNFESGWLNFSEAVRLEAEYRRFVLSLMVDSRKQVCELAGAFKDRSLFWEVRRCMNFVQTTQKMFPKAPGLDERLAQNTVWPEFPDKCAGDGFFYTYNDPIDACQGCPNCGDYQPYEE